MLCPYLLISINELLISIISFIDINKYGLNVKTAVHSHPSLLISIIKLLISIKMNADATFFDINNSFIDINKTFIDINKHLLISINEL